MLICSLARQHFLDWIKCHSACNLSFKNTCFFSLFEIKSYTEQASAQITNNENIDRKTKISKSLKNYNWFYFKSNFPQRLYIERIEWIYIEKRKHVYYLNLANWYFFSSIRVIPIYLFFHQSFPFFFVSLFLCGGTFI